MAAKLGKVMALAIPVAIAAVLAARRAKAAGVPPTPPVPPSKPPTPGVPPVPDPSPPPTQPVGGGSFIASLPEQYSGYPNDPREQMLLQGVRDGLYDPIDWLAFESKGDPGSALEGYSLFVPVMGDALKFEGVRVISNFDTAQYISDELSARERFVNPITMQTPWAAGMVYEQAEARLTPTISVYLSNKDVTALKSQFIEASAAVDKKLATVMAKKGLSGPVLVGNPGKDWVVTDWYTKPGSHPKTHVPYSEGGANHGLYSDPWKPIQNVGMAHNRLHTDYSQTLRFLGGDSVLVLPDKSSVPIATAEVMMHDFLGPLLNGPKGRIRGKQVGEGVLPYYRHPKVPSRILTA